MIATKSIDVRENFKSFCDQVYSGETLIISRPRNENIVMISEKAFNDFQKAKQNAEFLKMIDDSIKQIDEGHIIIKTIGDLKSYE